MKPLVQYVVAECRPCSDTDDYADICIGDNTYIFANVEPAEDIEAAMLITIDIERINPSHRYITLHAGSILKLCRGIQGETLAEI